MAQTMASYTEIAQEFATQQMDHEASNIQTSIKRASRNLRTTRVGAGISRFVVGANAAQTTSRHMEPKTSDGVK
jgi:hypothetical protein